MPPAPPAVPVAASVVVGELPMKALVSASTVLSETVKPTPMLAPFTTPPATLRSRTLPVDLTVSTPPALTVAPSSMNETVSLSSSVMENAPDTPNFSAEPPETVMLNIFWVLSASTVMLPAASASAPSAIHAAASEIDLMPL